MKVLCCAVAVAVLMGPGVLSLYADGASPVSPVASATDRQALKAQIQDIEAQIKAVHAEIQQLNEQKASLWDQVGSLRSKKHLADLQSRLDQLGLKITEAQAKSNTAKVTELSGRQALLQKELSLQQDMAALQVKLQAAHVAADTPTAKTLADQIKADHESVKSLYPAKPATASPVSVTAAVKPAGPAKQEDPEIQSLLDRIHVLEDQIKQDKAKIEGLKQQVGSLKVQMKAAHK